MVGKERKAKAKKKSKRPQLLAHPSDIYVPIEQQTNTALYRSPLFFPILLCSMVTTTGVSEDHDKGEKDRLCAHSP